MQAAPNFINLQGSLVMIHLTPFLTAYFMVLAFVLGTVMASFLGCLGWRMCKGESVLKGRSHCDSCGHVLGARDLIPIISYLNTKGHCRYCGASISKLNLYGEWVLGILFAVVTYSYGDLFQISIYLFFVCILYLVTVTDIYEQIIPDGVLITAIVVKVAHYIVMYQSNGNIIGNIVYINKPPLWSALLGLLVDGLAISLPLLILVLLMEKLWKKEAMGGGDIKLLFVTGLYLGWAKNLLTLLLACIIGIVVGTIQQKKAIKNAENEESDEKEGDAPFYFAFGPSIAVSAGFVMLFGNIILDWYLSLF